MTTEEIDSEIVRLLLEYLGGQPRPDFSSGGYGSIRWGGEENVGRHYPTLRVTLENLQKYLLSRKE